MLQPCLRTRFRAGLCSVLLAMFAISCLTNALMAQTQTPTLSDTEVEQVRQARYVPSDCILLFVKFLDKRMKQIQDLYAKPRRLGREDDTREILNQFTAITDELADNLDDYGPRHADLRKALPKVVDATERWASAIKAPPDDDVYDVARRITLESIRDLRESATQMEADQATWFKAHPPGKEERTGPIDIPR